jgi:hypothetical protein
VFGISHAKTESFTITCMAVLAVPQIQVQGHSKLRTRTALRSYGTAMPRSI